MKSRACRPPAMPRDAVPTAGAVQQSLPLAEPAPPRTPLVTGASAARAERLWFCIWLPNLPLEASRTSDAPTAVVEDQHGIHRVLLADPEAQAAGVMPGQAANAA